MTTITIEQSLLEQALTALETMTDEYDDSAVGLEIEAIHALRAALAAPATAPEPVACLVETEAGAMVWPIADIDEAGTYCEPDEFPILLYRHPPATALEKTVKEIMEFARHYAANTFSSATLEDKIRRALVVPATAPDERVKELEAELAATEIAIAEYRQQCLDNAAEIARLKAESEERLQNCAALVAEIARLRAAPATAPEFPADWAQTIHYPER